MLYEKQNIQGKHCSNVLKFFQSLQHDIRPLFAFGLFCFYSKVWMYLTCLQEKKKQNRERITHSSLNQHVFINSRNKKAMANFWSRLWLYQTNINILKTFYTVKHIPEVYLEPSRVVIFSKKLRRRCSTWL